MGESVSGWIAQELREMKKERLSTASHFLHAVRFLILTENWGRCLSSLSLIYEE